MNKDQYAFILYRAAIKTYFVGTSYTGDQYDSYNTKKEALLSAREAQIRADADPNFVLDLTSAQPEELVEYFRTLMVPLSADDDANA